MNKLLIAESPLQVLPSLAQAIGLNEAIVLQQLHYLLRNSDATHDGSKWVCLAYDDWHNNHFPFWSISTLKRIVKSLDARQLISKTSKYNRYAQDQTRWYSIDYARLNRHIASYCTPSDDAMSNRLLIDEPPLQVLPTLALTIGLNEAIFLQQLHYISLIKGLSQDNILWVNITVEALVEKYFPFWSKKTLRRVLHSLAKDNLIFTTTKYNKYDADRTNSYSVNYDRLHQIGNNISNYIILDNHNVDKVQSVHSRVSSCPLQSVKLSTLQSVKLSTLQSVKLSTPYMDKDLRDKDDDKTSVVVVSSDVFPGKTKNGPPADSTADIPTRDEIADAVAMFDGSPLAGLISSHSIKEAIAAYDPSAHSDYQPESPLDGVRRLGRWMIKIASHTDMPTIHNPAGFLIALSKKGMDKPSIVARQEVMIEKNNIVRQREMYESHVTRLQREYPGVDVAGILDRCTGASGQIPTDEQLVRVREDCRLARIRADAARDRAMEEMRSIFANDRGGHRRETRQ
mgnify:CR=1 FL=1